MKKLGKTFSLSYQWEIIPDGGPEGGNHSRETVALSHRWETIPNGGCVGGNQPGDTVTLRPQ